MKALDLISSNTGITLDKTLQQTYNLLTTIKNDTVLIDYGDGSTSQMTLNSSILKSFNN